MRSVLLRLLVTSLMFPEIARAEVFGDIDVLPLVAERERANRNALRTWRGKCVVRHLVLGDEEHKNSVRHTVHFVLDRTTPGGHSLRWRMHIEGGTVANISDMIERPQVPRIHHGLLRGATFVEILPYRVEGGRASQVAVRERVDGVDGGQLLPNPRFDPMFYTDKFEFSIGGQAEFLHERAGQLPLNRWHVRREGELVIMEVTHAKPPPQGRGTLVNRYVVDLSKGASLLSFRSAQDGRTEGLWEYEYEKVGGVWIVKRGNYKQIRNVAGEAVVLNWRIEEFSESVVNERIDPKEFTWAALGVPKGCLVIDERPGPGKGPSWRYDPEQRNPLWQDDIEVGRVNPNVE